MQTGLIPKKISSIGGCGHYIEWPIGLSISGLDTVARRPRVSPRQLLKPVHAEWGESSRKNMLRQIKMSALCGAIFILDLYI